MVGKWTPRPRADRILGSASFHFQVLRRRAAQLDLHREIRDVGSGTMIGLDGRLIGGDRIRIGEGVHLGDRTWLQTITEYAGISFEPSLTIGDRVSMQDDCHIAAIGDLVIEEDTLIAGGVLITDHRHGYRDLGLPIRDNPLYGGGLRIGAGSHIGQNACVLGDVTIGRHCVVAANAVVTKDVPDFTVVGGIPARVIATLAPEPDTQSR